MITMTILKETEALGGKVTRPRSLSQEMVELGLEPGFLNLPWELLPQSWHLPWRSLRPLMPSVWEFHLCDAVRCRTCFEPSRPFTLGL